MEALVDTSIPSSSHWRDRRVLLTGATGFLGGWILERLLRLGAEPVCLVRDGIPRARAVASGLIDQAMRVSGCVEDYAVLERAINEYEVRTVIHLAAQTIVGIANANPLSTFDSNIKGTWNVLEASRRCGSPESIVIASSDKAYGDVEALPYNESLPLRGSHPYDVSKSCADLIAAAYHRTYGMPVTITRCGNFYGPGDLNWNRLVPGTIRSVIRGEDPFIRSNGTPRRDYIHVEDAAIAYLCLAEQTVGRPRIHGQAFNFSNEDPRSTDEMIALILKIAGRGDLSPQILDRAKHEVQDQFLNSAKARETLGWAPTYGLDDGLRQTFAWYRDHLGRLGAFGSETA